MVSVQKRNSELVDILRPDFQARYEPNFAWVNAVSAFSMLPGLRGFWPCSAVGDSVGGVNSDTTDISGQGRHLTNTGRALHNNSGLIPQLDFDGTNDYLSRADEAGLDIIGNEGYIKTVKRGLTMGGWFRPLTIPPAFTVGYMTKYNTTGNQRSYMLYNNGTQARFLVSVDGINNTSVNSSVTLVQDEWHFLVGRFEPSTELAIFNNGTFNTNVVAIPATIFNSNSSFMVGAHNGGAAGNRANVSTSLLFLCAYLLPDVTVNALFQQTRALFGV